MSTRWPAKAGALAAVLVALIAADTQGQVPPDEKYLRLQTEHFRVVFPQGMEPFARLSAASAERAYQALAEHFVEPPSGRIALVIGDNTDRPNAFATPIPDNRVVLLTAPHISNATLNYSMDWVYQTLVHELAHIFHLDRADGIWGLGQAIFGRLPAFFPAFYQPRWVIEGLATYYESRLTGAGRAYGSAFDMLLNTQAGAGELRTVDAADGLAPIWPAGRTPYSYGGLYFRSMAEQFGDSAVAALVRRGAARLPYTFNWASTPYFGRTMTGSYQDWRASFESQALAREDSLRAMGVTVSRPMSGLSWVAPAPRYSPDGRRLAYTLITPRDDPTTFVIDATTGAVVLRERRNGSGDNTWSRDGAKLYLAQNEYSDRYDIFSDLYTLDVPGGKERRLTRGGRVTSPDMAPDGRSLVAVENGEGANRLVRIDIDSGELTALTPFADSVNWEHPRFSPDGTRIAVERWLKPNIIDVVVLDGEGDLLWEITSDDALDVTPAWSPDGRWLLWSSDRDGAPDIYAVAVETLAAGLVRRTWRVTRTLGGATAPDVAPDGMQMAFVGLYPMGMRLEVMPFDSAAWQPASAGWRSLRSTPAPLQASQTIVDAPVRSYSPFPSLWPKSWLPLVYTGSSAVGTFVGASIFGTDDIRRHSYAMLAGWRTGAEAVEAALFYRYAGLGDPVLELATWQDWSTITVGTSDGPVRAVEREREIRLGANFLRPRIRTALSIVPLIGWEERHFTPADTPNSFSDFAIRDYLAGLFVGFSTARGYPRSVSTEKGYVLLADLAHRRSSDDWDRWRLSAQGALRGYLSFPAFGYANHVLALRLSSGASTGRERGAELFELGGIPGRGIDIVAGVEIGGGSRYPVRGYSEGAQIGDRVVSGSVEYRFPIFLVGRGYGLWPVLLDRVSGSLFVEAGSAWFDSDDIDVLASAGSELSFDLGLGYAIVYRFRLGLAVPVDGSGQDPSLYIATGIAF